VITPNKFSFVVAGAQHENELAPWADNWGERFQAAGHDFLPRIAAGLPSITNHAGVMHLSMTPELCNLPPSYRGFQPAQLTGVATVFFVVEISTASIAGAVYLAKRVTASPTTSRR
jgi:hypothetical protein